MKKHSVALLGSRPLAERFLRHLSGLPDVEVAGVVTLPRSETGWWGTSLADAAEGLKIPVVAEAELAGMPLDVIFSINHDKLIREPLLSHPKKGIVNVHHSYRLRQRGRFPGSWAILNARADNLWLHGTTLHYIDENLDRGRIIATEAFEFGEYDTAKDLYEKADELAFRLLVERLPAILFGDVPTTEPDPQARYFGARSLDDKRIDHSWPAERIWDFVRAQTFPPFEQPFMEIGGRHFSLYIRKPPEPRLPERQAHGRREAGKK